MKALKALEAYCKARGYSGGTIWMLLEDIQNHTWANPLCDPYKWGLREGQTRRHGDFIGDYPVPVNSWSDTLNERFTLSYLRGVDDGLKSGYTFQCRS